MLTIHVPRHSVAILGSIDVIFPSNPVSVNTCSPSLNLGFESTSISPDGFIFALCFVPVISVMVIVLVLGLFQFGEHAKLELLD